MNREMARRGQKVTNILMGIGLALVLISLTFVPFGGLSQAAPPAAPTPVADAIFGNVLPLVVDFQSATAITADTNTTGIDVMKFSALDLQYVIDHGTINTTTLTVQYSNDNTNWVSGVALVSASAADGTTITRVPVFGRWVRINQDVATTDTITITLKAVGR